MSATGVSPHRLVTGHRHDPLGLPARHPLLSWSVDGGPLAPGSFEVRVAESRAALAEPEQLIWSTHTERPWVVYDGPPLGSRDRRYWQVVTAAPSGRASSEPATFEVGLAGLADWHGSWVAPVSRPFRRESWDPCPHLRRTFTLEDQPERARLYATALGIYRVWVNGTELTADALFRPGWTDYRRRLYHQTFDCTHLLRRGTNVIAVVLANGWYAGRLGLLREPGFYGNRPAFRAQLETSGPDGATSTLVTDQAWRVGYGAIQATDLIRGEVQDLRQEPRGWRDAGFDDGGWAEPDQLDHPAGVILEPQPHDSIRAHRVHEGRLVHEHGRGPAVFDFGQNIVGWTRIESPLEPSVELIVRHGEILSPHRRVYSENLRGAFQEDRYAVGERGPHRLEPLFTLHGFRYAEVWGLPQAPGTDSPASDSESDASPQRVGFQVHPDAAVTAVSVETGHDAVGTFECSDERLNALARSIEWTVRDNFLEVATDCPQRDERMGWLGDAGVIAPTAAYMFDVGAFLAKFTQDAADAQTADGAIPSYVPSVPPSEHIPGAPGWADGFVRLVHLLVERYADVVSAARLFDHVRRFVDHVDRHNPDGLRVSAVGADFGDWLSLPEHDGHTIHPGYEYTGAYSTSPRAVVGTAHSYRTFVEAARIAGRLGHLGESERYAARAEEIRAAYRAAFVATDGTIDGATQTVYAQAVGYGLVRDEEAEMAVEHLAGLIEQRGHLTTGIHGTGHVLAVLARHGHEELAVRMLLRDEYPGWLHMLASGATTIWERWDGIKPDGTVATSEMNSFNHYALGGIGTFLYERLAGLDASALSWDGRVDVRPLYTPRLDWVRASYQSPSGTIESGWRRDGATITHQLNVPATAVAHIYLPDGWTLRSGAPAAAGPADVRLGPGRHDLVIASAESR
ncbi:alpha-L-rhamnosidase [Phytoactinopolyspora limicola]|uniref:alpha-L-rhamnosidase n=1 Tax=Phytoactinopolyspora limicola TaxID=2715536 RepID=UPI00140A60B4|nr:alpha-L-rhamnosidase [Phytoactinopolyspora limicola]